MTHAKYRLKAAGAGWWRQNINCLEACPVQTDVPAYIACIAEGKFGQAFDLNRKANVFPAILGRICMHPCEKACRRRFLDEPVAIRALKRACADHKPDGQCAGGLLFSEKARRLAVVGAGPAGLTVADDLVRSGCRVTVFEALPVVGGMLNVGIPPYRLARGAVQTIVGELERMGVEIRLNAPVGQAVTLEQLQADFDAVLIAAGAHAPIRLNIPGESLTGVLHGVTFMRKVNLNEAIPLGRRVAVIGGGNTAIDCARSARYLGAEAVTVLYRRTRDEMPVSAEEVFEAEEEGVQFEFLVSPVRIIGDSDGRVTGLACIRNRLSSPDSGNRPRPVPIEGTEFLLPVDMVLPAVSQSPDTSFLPNVFSCSKGERVEVDPTTFMTNVAGVFAVGDYITGPRDVISVIADAHQVAASIRGYLEGPDESGEKSFAFKPAWPPHAPGSNYEVLPRQKMPALAPTERQSLEEEVQLGFTSQTAMVEARRCLRCDHNILIDSTRCILCAGCLDVCPHGCIQMIPTDSIKMDDSVPYRTDVKPGTVLVLDEAYCIRCGLCIERCPTGAIRMERFDSTGQTLEIGISRTGIGVR